MLTEARTPAFMITMRDPCARRRARDGIDSGGQSWRLRPLRCLNLRAGAVFARDLDRVSAPARAENIGGADLFDSLVRNAGLS